MRADVTTRRTGLVLTIVSACATSLFVGHLVTKATNNAIHDRMVIEAPELWR